MKLLNIILLLTSCINTALVPENIAATAATAAIAIANLQQEDNEKKHKESFYKKIEEKSETDNVNKEKKKYQKLRKVDYEALIERIESLRN
jgi:hypothetical protein